MQHCRATCLMTSRNCSLHAPSRALSFMCHTSRPHHSQTACGQSNSALKGGAWRAVDPSVLLVLQCSDRRRTPRALAQLSLQASFSFDPVRGECAVSALSILHRARPKWAKATLQHSPVLLQTCPGNRANQGWVTLSSPQAPKCIRRRIASTCPAW